MHVIVVLLRVGTMRISIYIVAGLIVTLLTLILWETERADTTTGRRGIQPGQQKNKKNQNK